MTKKARTRTRRSAARASDDDDVVILSSESGRLLSTMEVADRINCSRQALWAWCKQGRFPAPKVVFGRAMWTQETIDQWIEALPTRTYR